MTVATFAQAELRASYAFIERNLNLVKRYWGWEIVWLTYSVVNSLSVSFIGLGMVHLGGRGLDSRFLVLYLAIGALVWHYLSVVFYWVVDTIMIERWEGTIEYTLMAPVRRVTHMAGQTAFAVGYSMVHTSVILAATALFFDISLADANLAGGALVMIAGSLSFVGIGIIGSVLPLLFPERGSQMTRVIIATLLLVSGVYFPVEVLPASLQAVSRFSPATYVLSGVRSALLDGTATAGLWGHVWPLLGIGVVAIPIGLAVFAWAEAFAKRTGRLHRNG